MDTITSPHNVKKNELFAAYLTLKDAGELRGPEVAWTPDEDRVLLTERVSVRELAVRTRRTIDAVRDRQDALYVLDTSAKFEAVEALGVSVPVLDCLGQVKRTDDPGVVLPAAVIAGAKGTDPRDLIDAARDRLKKDRA